VARTFATYVLRPFDIAGGPLVPMLAVGVIVFAFLVNIAGNRSVGLFSLLMAVIKVGGIALFGVAALWSSGFSFAPEGDAGGDHGVVGFIASVALAILAFKGFTTITNSGAEITDPHRNVARAIIISIAICVVVYLLVAYGVGSSLSIEQIIAARDYSLAEAAAPALGQTGFILTVVLAAVATASGLLASVFAVSRMLAMLTDMKMIPHSHFGMSGSIQRHTLIYTVVIASLLAIFFDLSRIASLGAFFYLIMDMVVHWGVFRYRRREVGARAAVLLAALAFDAIVLAAFTAMKLQSDPLIVLYAALAISAVFAFERFYLSRWLGPASEQAP
jgi:amino acid transporter